MGDGHELYMPQALHLRNHLDAKTAAVLGQIPGLGLGDEAAVGHAIVGEGGPNTLPALSGGGNIGIIHFRVALEFHAGGNLQQEKVVAHGGEDMFDHIFKEGDVLPGGDHQVGAPEGVGWVVLDFTKGKLSVPEKLI